MSTSILTTFDEVQDAVRTAWINGATSALGEVISQCNGLLESTVLRDPIAIKVVRDWCEMASLELSVNPPE